MSLLYNTVASIDRIYKSVIFAPFNFNYNHTSQYSDITFSTRFLYIMRDTLYTRDVSEKFFQTVHSLEKNRFNYGDLGVIFCYETNEFSIFCAYTNFHFSHHEEGIQRGNEKNCRVDPIDDRCCYKFQWSCFLTIDDKCVQSIIVSFNSIFNVETKWRAFWLSKLKN